MKKIYSIVALLAITFAANAQRQSAVSAHPMPAQTSVISAPHVLSATDTISSGFDWSTANPTMYTVGLPQGGFLVGSNGYLDHQKVQVYDPGQGVIVYGAIYWFGAKTVTTANSTVAMRVYHIDGLGNSTTSSSTSAMDTPCPNTTYVSDAVPLGNVDTSLSLANAYVHTFSTPQWCAGAFGVGFDVTNVNVAGGDTIGLVSSTDGEYDMNATGDYNWEQWDPASASSWHSIAASWTNASSQPLMIDLAIFPIVEMNTGINETPFVNGVKLGFAGPNPVTDNTVITYGLQNNVNNVTITIVDVQGKTVKTESLGNHAAGSYSYNLDASGFATGTYFVQLSAGNSHLAVKMVKN